jgi:adenosine deaminase
VRPAWLSGHKPPLTAPIPIEVCPTSNSLTLSLPGLQHHPTLSPWLERDYPFSICTDDSGVFGVTLSQEYATVASTFGLSAARMAQLALQSFQHAFVSASERARLVAVAQNEIDAVLAAEATGALSKASTA